MIVVTMLLFQCMFIARQQGYVLLAGFETSELINEC